MAFVGHVEGQFTIPAGITISVTTNAGTSAVPITAGAYFIDDFIVQLDADLESGQTVSGGNWVVSLNTTTGFVTIAVTNGTFSITWTSTLLRDLLGYTGNITTQASVTTSKYPRGLWIPDCPVTLSGHIDAAPRVTDLRQAVTPTGRVFGHIGNTRYKHTGVTWSLVETARVWIVDSSNSTSSLEWFLGETQWGLGHSWFTPSAKVRITAHTGDLIGESFVTGWYLIGVTSMEGVVRRASEGWDGLWAVEIPSMQTDS